METNKIGRIRPTFIQTPWDIASEYTVLDVVRSSDGMMVFCAKKDVPVGISLTNTDYWALVIDNRPYANNESNGGYYIPNVSSDGNLSWMTNQLGMPSVDDVNIKGPKGDDGADGFSPVVTVTDIPGGHRITVIYVDGSQSFDVMDGYCQIGLDGTTFTPSVDVDGLLTWRNDGEKPNPDPVNIKGPQGNDGSNGVSATHYWNGTTLTVTSASGTSSADLKGAKGDKGDPGESGVDYVVAQGVTEPVLTGENATNGSASNWLWRKWNSGIAECWIVLRRESAFSSAWTPLYESYQFPMAIYPVEFIESPMEFVTGGNNVSGAWAEVSGQAHQTLTNTNQYQLIRPAKSTEAETLALNLYVVGRWK